MPKTWKRVHVIAIQHCFLFNICRKFGMLKPCSEFISIGFDIRNHLFMSAVVRQYYHTYGLFTHLFVLFFSHLSLYIRSELYSWCHVFSYLLCQVCNRVLHSGEKNLPEPVDKLICAQMPLPVSQRRSAFRGVILEWTIKKLIDIETNEFLSRVYYYWNGSVDKRFLMPSVFLHVYKMITYSFDNWCNLRNHELHSTVIVIVCIFHSYYMKAATMMA